MKIKVIYIVIIVLSIIFIVMGLYSNVFFKGEKLVYKGVDYVGADGDYIKDTLIGKTRDGWKLYSIKGDNNNYYIVAKGNRDEFLYVKESYSRKIDKIEAIWFGDNNGHYTENEEIIDYMKSLLKKKSTHKYDINLNEYENGWQKNYGNGCSFLAHSKCSFRSIETLYYKRNIQSSYLETFILESLFSLYPIQRHDKIGL